MSHALGALAAFGPSLLVVPALVMLFGGKSLPRIVALMAILGLMWLMAAALLFDALT